MTRSEDRAFQVGQLVRWQSASRGTWRDHVGVVVSIVPPGGLVEAHLPMGEWRYHFRLGGTRREASYLVALKADRGPRAAGALYWPRTRHLAVYGAAPSKPVLAPLTLGAGQLVRTVNEVRDRLLDLQLESLAADLRPASPNRAAHLALFGVIGALAVALVIGVFLLFPALQ